MKGKERNLDLVPGQTTQREVEGEPGAKVAHCRQPQVPLLMVTRSDEQISRLHMFEKKKNEGT